MANKTIKNPILRYLLKNRPSKKDKELILENLGEMLATKIDITVAIKILKSEVKSKAASEILENFDDDIQSGYPIWKSIKKARLLQDSYLAIIRIGEESGRLPENTAIVISQIKKDKEFRSRIQSASIYPIFIFVIMLTVALSISLFVLPRLSVVYKSLNADLPLITKILIGIGDFLQQYGSIAIPIFFIVSILIIFFVFIFSKTKWIGQNLLLSAPVIKKLITEVEISRMGILLGTLIESGFPILESLKLLEYSSTYFKYKKLYSFLYSEIESGQSFQQAFDKYKNIQKLLPFYARQLIISSQQTGTLPKSLMEIGDIYEKKNMATTKDLSVLLEPILLVIIWLGVAFIALAIILPIYSLIGNITDLSTQRVEEVETSVEIIEKQPASFPEDYR